jgi:hypothetical protein
MPEQKDYSYAYPPRYQGSVGLQGGQNGVGAAPQPYTHLHRRTPMMSQSKSSEQLRMRRKAERLEQRPTGMAGGGFGYQNKARTPTQWTGSRESFIHTHNFF